MYSQRSESQIPSSSETFRLLALPAEVRLVIYSFIVLAPHKQNMTRSKRTMEDDRYFQKRHLCHQAAKSLQLICKYIKTEITPMFWRNKTICLCLPGKELNMMHPNTNFISSIDQRKLSLIRHVELDLHQTLEDVENGNAKLMTKLTIVNNYLKIVTRNLPALQTIVCKFADTVFPELTPDSNTPWMKRLRKTPPTPDSTDFNAGANKMWHIGHRLPRDTSWFTNSAEQRAAVQTFVQEASLFHQWATGLGRLHLPNKKWVSSRTVYKTGARSDKNYIVHEVKYEKWSEMLMKEVKEQYRLREEEMKKRKREESEDDIEMRDEDDDNEEEKEDEEEVDKDNHDKDEYEYEYETNHDAMYLELFSAMEQEEEFNELIKNLEDMI